MHVALPMEYPYKSPSIGFENRMYHPNVDEMSGSVCLDVISQTWSPMFGQWNVEVSTLEPARGEMLTGGGASLPPPFSLSPFIHADLVNIFTLFLPQLLRYPNPTDPLNGEAAALMIRDKVAYEAKIRDGVVKYARGISLGDATPSKGPVSAKSRSDGPGTPSTVFSSSSSDTMGVSVCYIMSFPHPAWLICPLSPSAWTIARAMTWT